MPIELYPNIAKVKRNGVYQNLPGFVQASGDADIKAMIATSETTTTAQFYHKAGSYFILNDVLYQADENIAVNDIIAVGTNCHVEILGNDVEENTNNIRDLKNEVNSLNFSAFGDSTKWGNYGIMASTGVKDANPKRISLLNNILFKGGNYKISISPEYFFYLYKFSTGYATITYDGILQNNKTYAKSGTNALKLTEYTFSEGIDNGHLYNIAIGRNDNEDINTAECINLKINVSVTPEDYSVINDVKDLFLSDEKNNYSWEVGGINANTGAGINYSYSIRTTDRMPIRNQNFLIDPSKVRVVFWFYSSKTSGYIGRIKFDADDTTERFNIHALAPINAKYYWVAIWNVKNGSVDTSTAITTEDIPDILENIEIESAVEQIPYNVKSYGATGDGETNDTQSIQSVFDMCGEKGGYVYFPSGTYKIGNQLIFYSNMHIVLEQGATILRGAEKNGVLFSHCTNSTLAYNGVQNVIIEGGTIDLGTGISQGGLGIGIIHGNNIVIKNVTFKHVNAGYHSLDICCSKNIKIENCIFTDLLTNTQYGECIQIDSADQFRSFPSPELSSGASTFDSTPTINVEICGCKFDLNNYSPAIGNHNSMANKRIFFHDNIIVGNGGSRGAVAFDNYAEYYPDPNATTEVLIHHNIFEGCTYGFCFGEDSTGHFYVRDNILKDIGTLKVNADVTSGEFLNNIELSST